jgi:hypothetical protein
MKSIITIALFGICGLAYAQSSEKPENEVKIKEVPAASHGKTVSEVAKNTPGSPEKGKLISSAARQQSMAGSRPVNSANKSKGSATSGKSGNVPRAIPPARPRPAGYHGGN